MGYRNSYRWGVDGQFDVELVESDEKAEDCPVVPPAPPADDTRGEVYDNMVKYALELSGTPLFADFYCQGVGGSGGGGSGGDGSLSGHEWLTTDEQMRAVLWKTPGFGAFISTFIRLFYSDIDCNRDNVIAVPGDDSASAHTSGYITVSVYHQLVGAALVLASYDATAASSLEFTLPDIAFLVAEVAYSASHLADGSRFSNGVNCAKLLSVLSSSGVLFQVMGSAGESDVVDNIFLSISHILSSLTRNGKAFAEHKNNRENMTLSLSLLRFLHDMLLFAIGVYYASTHDTHHVEFHRGQVWTGFFGAVCVEGGPPRGDGVLLSGPGSSSPSAHHLLDLLARILSGSPSASALSLSVDMIVALVDTQVSPGCPSSAAPPRAMFGVVLLKGVDGVLVTLADRLRRVEVTPSSHVALRIVTSAMLLIEQRMQSDNYHHLQQQQQQQLSVLSSRSLLPIPPPSSSSSQQLLLDGILDFAESTRDFSGVVGLLWAHMTGGSSSTLCRCIEILLGGKKRPTHRPFRRFNERLLTSGDDSKVPVAASSDSIAPKCSITAAGGGEVAPAARPAARVRAKGVSSSWRRELAVGSCIDAKDKSHHWYEAVVKDTRRREPRKKRRSSTEEGGGEGEDEDEDEDEDAVYDSSDSDEEDAAADDWVDVLGGQQEVFVHYSGWGDKYDEWVPCSSDRLQRAHAETGYWREHLRLDEPIEILCLHYEHPSEAGAMGVQSAAPEVKRRWFRGVVASIVPREGGDGEGEGEGEGANDRILVVYDKRGCREERWVDLQEREEICKVGTHVPASLLGPLGFSGEGGHQNHSHSHLLLKGARKKELLESGGMEVFLDLLKFHFDKLQLVEKEKESSERLESFEIMQTAFEGLYFLLPSLNRRGGEGNSNIGADNMMSDSSRLCALAALRPAALLCQCIAMLLSSGCLRDAESSSPPGQQSRSSVLAEDIVETACGILASLASSLDAQVFSVGDMVDSQWRRRGNVSFPGRITRIRDGSNISNNVMSISTSSSGSGLSNTITLDISYDDGDREERVPLDRVSHRSSVAYYRASDFLASLVACGGPAVLLSLLAQCGSFLPEEITTSVLSVLSSVIESQGKQDVEELFWRGIDWGSRDVSWFGEATSVTKESKLNTTRAPPLPYAKVLFHMLSEAASLKSSSRLVMQSLNFYRVLAESSVLNKNRVFATGAHALSILCLSAFPHHPQVLCQALKLLSAIASKDGTIEAPECQSSSGPAAFNPTQSAARRYFWQSEDRAPSEAAPHWIDICLPVGRRWREVQLCLGDYGSASPELIVVKYAKGGARGSVAVNGSEKEMSTDTDTDTDADTNADANTTVNTAAAAAAVQYFEIKRANIGAAEGWVTLVHHEEVSKVLATSSTVGKMSDIADLLCMCLFK
jgi:hypothetical protein